MAEGRDIAAEVKRIIKEQLDVDEAEIRPEMTFIDDLGADSLGLVELVLAFEEAFTIDIPDEDTEKIRTVQDAIDYIEKNVKKLALKNLGLPLPAVFEAHFAEIASRHGTSRRHWLGGCDPLWSGCLLDVGRLACRQERGRADHPLRYVRLLGSFRLRGEELGAHALH